MNDLLCAENHTHFLQCLHHLGSAEIAYKMRCHVIKEMPDGERLKVLVHGERYWNDRMHIKKIRYVKKWRVSEAHNPKLTG